MEIRGVVSGERWQLELMHLLAEQQYSMFVLELIHRDCQVHGVTTGGAGPGRELSTWAQSKGFVCPFCNENNSFSNFVCTTLLLPPHPIPPGSEVLLLV